MYLNLPAPKFPAGRLKKINVLGGRNTEVPIGVDLRHSHQVNLLNYLFVFEWIKFNPKHIDIASTNFSTLSTTVSTILCR
jgi:hypothetical protein